MNINARATAANGNSDFLIEIIEVEDFINDAMKQK